MLRGEDAARRRIVRVFTTIVSSMAVRLISFAISLFTVPLTLNYLGSERYGVWLTIASVNALLGFADFGIGNGLMNTISDAYGRGDKAQARRAISSAFLMLTGVMVVLASLFLLANAFVSWADLFNVQSPLARQEVGGALGVFALVFLVNIPLGVAPRVQAGYQEAFIGDAFIVAGRVLSAVALLIVIAAQGGLVWLVLALVGVPFLLSLINIAYFFLVRHRDLLPRLGEASRGMAASLLRLGGLFFVLQLAVVVAYSSDSLVLARMLGPEAVTQYAVPYQLFGFVSTFIYAGLSPLWPAYGEALARRDAAWVQRIFKRSLLISFGVSLTSSVLLFLFGRQIIHLWVGPTVEADPLLMLALAIWQVLLNVSNATAMLLNGTSVIRFQVICAILMASFNIVFSITLTAIVGESGVVWGSILAQTIFTLIPIALYLPYLFRRIQR